METEKRRDVILTKVHQEDIEKGTFIVPPHITVIGEKAISGVKLDSLIITKGVREILNNAVANTGLMKVVLSNSVEIIRDGAFSNNQLTCVRIPENIREIGESAFKGNQLVNVILPNTSLNIKKDAFSNNSLTSIQVYDKLRIDKNAFDDYVVLVKKVESQPGKIMELRCYANEYQPDISSEKVKIKRL